MKNFELKNFPFEHDGMIYWWSRSLTGVNVVFCYSKIDNEWCVLADKRGEGCPTCIGMWNVPCGYCDTNETVKQTAIRESLEESGVRIPKDKCRFFTKLRRERCEVFSLAYESPCIINISKNHTQIIQKSLFLTKHNR